MLHRLFVEAGQVFCPKLGAVDRSGDDATGKDVEAGGQFFGAGQVMDFKTEYTYDGTAEKDGKTFDKITSKNLSVTFALENSPLPFSLKSADLKSPDSEGVILFDRERGQVVESLSKVRVTGDIIFSLNGKDLPAKLDLKMQSTTVVKN